MRRIEKRGAVNVLCDDDGNGCMPATRAEIEFFDEIERLRAENKSIGGEADAWRESAITCQRSASEFARQRDILLLERDSFGQQLIIVRAEVEKLKATLTQQCKGFRADVEKLEAEVEALRADAALKRDLLLWALYHAQGGSSRVGQAIRRHLGIEQHARLTPEQIKDAARAAQGEKA